MLDVVLFAHQLLDLNLEVKCLRAENEELRKYKKLYFELQNDSIKHAEAMSGQVLTLLLNKGEFPEDKNAKPPTEE